MENKVITSLVALSAISASLFFLADDLSQFSECLGKEYKYSINITDQIDSEAVYLCLDEAEYIAKKTDLLSKIANNQAMSSEGVSPSIEALLIAYHDQPFYNSLVDSLLMKYDSETHSFIGAEMGADFLEQRHLIFLLAGMRCGNQCLIEGATLNEWIYNILISENYGANLVNKLRVAR